MIKLKDNKDGLLELFDNENPIPKWKEYVENLNKEPIMKVIKEIINDIEPWKNYSYIKEIREERKRRLLYYRRNVEEIIEKLIESSDTDYLSINKIKQHLEIMILTKQEEEQREYLLDEGKNANILCLTVHKSKGLEFDTIIMPYCDEELTSTRKTGYVDLIVENQKKSGLKMKYTAGYKIVLGKKQGDSWLKELKSNLYENQIKNEKEYRKEEETRLLYVAMTRAIKNYIYFNNSSSNKKDTWQNLIKGV
jgi:ATP-dependent exoDNAse (exonuclease V) beta subunit